MPLPERKSLAGPCTVVFAGNGEMDVRLIGRFVAEVTERPLPDVTRELRTSKGFVSNALDAPKAVALAERVEKETNAPILVVADSDLVPLPAPMRMNRPHIDAAGLKCEAYTWDRTENVSAFWDDVYLIACGRIESQRVMEQNGGRGGRSAPMTTRTQHELLVDVVLTEPWRRLRLDQNLVALSFTEISRNPEEILGPLYRTALNLERYAKGIPVNSGVHLLATGAAEGAWEPLTFLNKRDFDSYVHWLMQLVRFGRPIPV